MTNLEKTALKIQEILHPHCPSAIVYPYSHLGLLAKELNEIFGEQIVPSSVFIVSTEQGDIENVMAITSLIEGVSISQRATFGGRAYFEWSYIRQA